MPVNCFTLGENGDFRPGIPCGGPKNLPATAFRELRIGRGNQEVSLPFIRGADLTDSPVISGGRLYETKPTSNNHLGARGTWDGAILMVCPADLRLPPEKSAYLGNIPDAWPGIEVFDFSNLLANVGRRSNPHQRQLVQIPHGSSHFVCDQNVRYMHITWRDGQFTSRPAQREEFARALVERAHTRRTTATARWTHNALRAMGLLERHWTPTLARLYQPPRSAKA
jgi:hypothetical protein